MFHAIRVSEGLRDADDFLGKGTLALLHLKLAKRILDDSREMLLGVLVRAVEEDLPEHL